MIWYGNRLKIFGGYQIKELTYIDMLTSASMDVWEESYLGAEVVIKGNCIKLMDNQGQIKQVKNPDYRVIQTVGEEALLQEYKDLLWGTGDTLADTIETTYVIEQPDDQGGYFMLWENSEGLYLVLYTKGAKKDCASLVAKLEQ